MRVAILADPGNADGTLGGAELTMREFGLAAPQDVELVDSLDCDTVIIGNCVTFSASLISDLRGKQVIRVHHDLARHESPTLREWLERHALHVFTSPLHQRLYGLPGEWPNIPPPIDADAFRPSRQTRRNGHRKGVVAIAPWQNPGKGQQLLKEWSEDNEPVDVYGTGPFTPQGPCLRNCGALRVEDVAEVLWRYRTFVHLPTAPEPFGRAVVEAHYAGCGLVVNRQVGALHYLENEPEKLETAAEDFWSLVGTEVVA